MEKEDIEFRAVKWPDDFKTVEKLLFDYLSWGNEQMKINFGVFPHNPADQVAKDIQLIDNFLPPNGQMILAVKNKEVCGVGVVVVTENGIGEIKRMFVDPTFRNLGIGRGILNVLLGFAKDRGLKKCA